MSKLHGKLTVKRLSGVVQAVPGKSAGELQEKTVTPSTEAQTVTPDGGYSGMNRVYVEPVELQAKSVEPSTSAQTVTPGAGYMGLSQVYVGAAPLQQKTATPAAEAQEITPDAGYYGLEKVAVEAAPLQEITITPTSEVQTITPDTEDGYIGFSKITVEAVEYDDSGGGGSGGGGSGDGEITTYPSASGITFGTETITEEVETGLSTYGAVSVLSFPGDPDYPYYLLYRRGNDYHMECYEHIPSYVSGSAYSWIVKFTEEYTGYREWTTPCTADGVCYPDGTWEADSGGGMYPSSTHTIWTEAFLWSNFPLKYYDGRVEEYGEPVPETETVTYEQTVGRDESYLIGGEDLNSIISIAQKITGTSDPMTVEEATQALDEYYAGLNEENTE